MNIEFKLVSGKYAFLPSDLSDAEMNIWKTYISTFNDVPETDWKIFHGPNDESVNGSVESVQVWNWDWKGTSILEMNACDVGVISMDGEIIGKISDDEIEWVKFPVPPNFKEFRSAIFAANRGDMRAFDPRGRFIETESGISSLQVAQDAYEDYVQRSEQMML